MKSVKRFAGYAAAMLLLGCQTLLGVDGRRDPALCERGQRQCHGGVPQECGEDFTWVDRSSACTGNTPACSAGECTAIVDLAAGSAHTCVVLADHTVHCWGHNSSGQLGFAFDPKIDEKDGGVASSPSPLPVPGLTGAASVAIGGSDDVGFTCTVLLDHTVECWGWNAFSQLGDGTNETRSTPMSVPGLADVTALDLGFAHGCAIRSGGAVACWGWNGFGQAGQDNQTPVVYSPQVVKGLEHVTSIAAGVEHTCALREDGVVLCWGGNSFGQTGQSIGATKTGPVFPPEQVTLPAPAGSATGRAKAIAAGDYHTCAIRDDGALFCWGRNSCGQLGNGVTCGGCPTPPCGIDNPEHVTLDGSSTGIALGAHSSCTVSNSTDGVECWGRNDFAQACSPIEVPVSGPMANEPLPRHCSIQHTKRLVSGSYHVCALGASGTLFCWGRNDRGQLGNGSVSDFGSAGAVVWR